MALEILISVIQRVYGVKELEKLKEKLSELEKLKEKLSLIRYVLENAEPKQFQKTSVQNWLVKLRDAAYDAEDILDEWATKDQKQDDESKSRKKIKEIIERFDEIKEQSFEFDLLEQVAKTRKEVGESSRDPTDSLVIESEIWGRDKDKKDMVELLLNGLNSPESGETMSTNSMRSSCDNIRPNCRCNRPATICISHTLKNPKRKFYCCEEKRCRYFDWVDSPKFTTEDKEYNKEADVFMKDILEELKSIKVEIGTMKMMLFIMFGMLIVIFAWIIKM